MRKSSSSLTLGSGQIGACRVFLDVLELKSELRFLVSGTTLLVFNLDEATPRAELMPLKGGRAVAEELVLAASRGPVWELTDVAGLRAAVVLVTDFDGEGT